MLLDPTFQKSLAQRPVAATARATREQAVAAEALDAFIEQTVPRQYRELAFSTVVAILQAVVFRQSPPVRSAYVRGSIDVPVPRSSLSDRLNHTEPGLAEAPVQHTAPRLRDVARQWPRPAEPAPGLRFQQLDGNRLAGTEQRLQELRGHGTARPGMALVVRDDYTGSVLGWQVGRTPVDGRLEPLNVLMMAAVEHVLLHELSGALDPIPVQ